MERTLRPLGQVLAGYMILIVGLFVVCSVTASLKATLWGFGILHFSCTLGMLALWWQEERRWSRTVWREDPEEVAPIPAISPIADQSAPPQEDSLPPLHGLSLNEEYPSTPASRAEALPPISLFQG